MTRLGEENRRNNRYGIRRKEQGIEVLIENTFSGMVDLIFLDSHKQSKYLDIGTLPVYRDHQPSLRDSSGALGKAYCIRHRKHGQP